MQGFRKPVRLNNVSGRQREEGRGLDDGNIIEAIRLGDREAYVDLVRKYEHRVYAMCLKATNRTEEAEDLVQEVFLSAYQGIQTFRGDAQFATWLYRIALRKCIDWQRKATYERNHTDLQGLDLAQRAGSGATPEDVYVAAEQSGQLSGLLGGLPEPYRSTVHMFYIEQRSYQEISDFEGVSVKTVESRLYRARKMLQEKGALLR